MSITDFLFRLRREISIFTENTLISETSTYEDRRLLIITQNLVLAYYNIIEFYFRDLSITGDNNFFSQSEIQEVIDKLNNIMKTYLYTDFS